MNWLRLDHLKAIGEGELIKDADGTTVEFRIPCRSDTTIFPARVCCTAPYPLKNGTKTIRYRDRRIEDVPTWLEIKRQRFKCKTCGGIDYEELPDLDDKHRITRRLREAIALSAVKRTFQDTATFHAIEETLAIRIFNEYAAEKLSSYEIKLPRVLGVDENVILGAPRFVCANIETGQVLDMLPTRDLKALRRYFDERMTFWYATEVFVQDMWNAYRSIHQEFFPSALLVIDKFHVVRQANQAFETIRKAYQASLTKDGRISMKRRHRMFLSRWSNLEEERRDKVMEVLSEHPGLQKAYLLKEGFFQIYEAETRQQAEQLYERWKDAVPQEFRSAFHPLVVSMRNWHEPIFNYYEARYTNGLVENLNGRINAINAAAHGMKFETLRAKALLRYGNIIPAGKLLAFDLGGMSDEEADAALSMPVVHGFDPSTLTRALKRGTF